MIELEQTKLETSPAKLLAAREHRLIVLAGSPRSGTSWLAALLDSYPRVVYQHEPLSRLPPGRLHSSLRRILHTGRADDYTRGLLLRDWSRAQFDQRAPWFFPKDYAPAPPRKQRLVWWMARFSRRGEAAYSRLFTPASDRFYDVLVKEVGCALRLSPLVQALRPSLLILRRHPCAVVSSLIRGRKYGFVPPVDRLRWYEENRAYCSQMEISLRSILRMHVCEFYALQWLIENTIYEHILQQTPRSLALVYEDLCHHPRAVLESVFEFLAWPVSPQTVQFLERSTRGSPLPMRDLCSAHHRYYSVIRHTKAVCNAWERSLTDYERDRILRIAGILPHFQAYWPEG